MNHIFARIGSHMSGGQFGSLLKELDIRYIRNRWGRATARGQGSTTKFSKASPTGDPNVNGDGHDYPFVIPYLSSTYGAPGGPTIGDDMVLLNRSANPQAPDWVIAGKLSSTKFDKDTGPFAYDASFTHNTGTAQDPAFVSIDEKVITAFEQAGYGGDFIWAYGIKNASNDHALAGFVDMDPGDGYDTMFCLIPIKDWSSYALFGADADTFPNYHGSGAVLALDGSIHAGGSLVIGKASGMVGAGRSNYPADYSVICVFDGAVTLGNSHDNYGHTIYGDVQFSGGSISLIAGATMQGFSLANGQNVALGTSTGTQFGTASTQKFAVLGATPASQQTGGAQTASGTYGATEESMLQTAYNALRTFGFIS